MNHDQTRAAHALAKSTALRTACALAFAPLASAQQFVEAPGVLPGPARWSEGVCAIDVDLDGDLDLLFADGDGFSTAGAKRQNVLLINRRVEQGPRIFADESVARLGVHLSNAKMVIAGDVTGDGWPDVLFANAFNTDPPSLYINRGAAQPGYFDLESASRGLTEALSSSGAAFGDVDDDGDLDLVLCDSGDSLLGGTGGRPRLYLNDGAGFFGEAPSSLPATIKRAHMDVHLVDVDGDFDLDLVQANRATNVGGNHYLMLNDGAGQFSDASSLLPNTSGNVYEMELGDLDGDSDLDLFVLSQSGFQEGHIQNRLAPTGALAFLAGAVYPGSVDDNEVALGDYDMDGDLDVFVGSLDARERVYRNDRGLQFADTPGIVQNIADSTLDLTLGDLDDDGAFDLVTAQGESGGFGNRVYWNNGPADNLAPRIVAMRGPAPVGAGGSLIVHAKVRDDVLDDGEAYLAAEVHVSRIPAATLEVEVSAFGFVPSVATAPTGTLVRFVEAGSGATILLGAPPFMFARSLGPGASTERAFVVPAVHTVTAAAVMGSFQLTVTGAPATTHADRSGHDLFRCVLPGLAPGPTGRVAFVWRALDRAGNVGWSDSTVADEPGVIGVLFCAPNANSTGAQARIVARGTDALAALDLTLEAYALPPGLAGFFVLSRTRDQVPVNQGVLCLGAPQIRLSANVLNSGASGAVSLAFPFSALPPLFASGETWNFQYWYRDLNPGAVANFTDAVELLWR